MMLRTTLFLTGLLALLAPAPAARAETFVVRPGDPNQVVFASKAPVESFQGKTAQMAGRIDVDPGAVGDSVTVRIEVDLASLDTGIAKRNQHMRENHLETAKYPKAVFTGAAVGGPAGAGLEPGKPMAFAVEGTFALHGVSRRLRTTVEVTLEEPGGKRQLRFKTAFPVSLAAYSISRPQFLFLKLADEQAVRVSGVATTE
jgi:polyisoprenoid-binding protein YceI